MFYISTSSLLDITAGTVGLELVFFALLLEKRKLFRWNMAGFWSWAAFLLYFVLVPIAITVNTDYLSETQKRLYFSGGTDRGLWVLLLVAIGIAGYFISYLRTTFKEVTWRLNPGQPQFKIPAILFLLAFGTFGFYSLLVFRAGLFSYGGERLIVGGRFMGDISGYQNGGYAFLFVPITLMLLSKKKSVKAFGWAFAVLFLFLSLPHAWSRFATVSFFLLLSLVSVVQKSKRWPGLHWLVGIILIASLFQLRGHREWGFTDIAGESMDLVVELPQKFSRILGSVDTGMLTTWYVESYFRDTWLGYDYGLPILNYLMTGWIPSRIFPGKYFMIDWLEAQWNMTNYSVVNDLFFGAKSTLFGSFYVHGGLVGVLLGGIIVGYLSRRVDGMLVEESPILLKSVAISWLSVLWMVWASSTTWGLMTMGTISMPALVVWFFSPKKSDSQQGIRIQNLDLNQGTTLQ